MERSEEEGVTKAGYDYWAASYDDKDPSTWLDKPFLLKHLHPFPGCRILDVGCGTGRYLRQLTTSRCRIIGLDLSRKMLARAKQYHGPRADICLVQASAGLTVVAMEEPRVTAAMLEHRPTWSSKIGRSALLLLALTKPGRDNSSPANGVTPLPSGSC